MKKVIPVLLVSGVVLSSCVSKKKYDEVMNQSTKYQEEIAALKTNKTMKLESEIDKVSYSLGVNVADNLAQQGFSEVNSEAFIKGAKDAFDKKETQISSEEAQGILQAYFAKKQAEQQAAQGGGQSSGQANGASQANANKVAGEQFLAANAKKPGVVTTASGLQYKVLKAADGPKPSATDEVKVHYHGTLIDGTVFDSSVERGEQISFPLNRVIPGWTEGVQLMSVGAKYRFFIPYNLAYGERGAGGTIGPFSALIFDVELFEIK